VEADKENAAQQPGTPAAREAPALAQKSASPLPPPLTPGAAGDAGESQLVEDPHARSQSDQRELIATVSDKVNFVEVLLEAVPELEQLLSSASASDVEVGSHFSRLQHRASASGQPFTRLRCT
jgi:hypothetical protein